MKSFKKKKDVPTTAAVQTIQGAAINRRTWASSVCCVLDRYGFDVVWENQGVGVK